MTEAWYVEEAERCRRRAEKSADPIEQEAWQKMANECLRLASSIEGKQVSDVDNSRNGPSGATWLPPTWRFPPG
jgi:hypothetical protein